MAQSTETSLVPIIVGGIVAVAVVGGLAWFAVGLLTAETVDTSLEALLAELPRNVDAIRHFEQELVSSGVDDPRPCSSEAEARASATRDPRPWSNPASCWVKIGWEPEQPIRGGYWVELTETGYAVHGVADLDGDGTWAEYVATEQEEAKKVSADGVY